MNNALRITLMVFALLVIVLITGTMFLNQIQKEITELTIEINQIDEKIEKIDEILAQNIEQRRELEKIKSQVEKFDKVILDYDSPPVTYQYLLNILENIDEDIIFDFTYSGQKQNNDLVNNSYLIRGTANLKQIYKFIASIEKQRPIYYIYDFAISAPVITVSDTVNYSFLLDSVSKSPVPQKNEFKLKDVQMVDSIDDLFICGLLEDKIAREENRKSRNEGLLDLSDLVLVAIVNSEALFRDKNGLFQVLKPGDNVINGSLIKIDAESGDVHFMIDKLNGANEKQVFNVDSGGLNE